VRLILDTGISKCSKTYAFKMSVGTKETLIVVRGVRVLSEASNPPGRIAVMYLDLSEFPIFPLMESHRVPTVRRGFPISFLKSKVRVRVRVRVKVNVRVEVRLGFGLDFLLRRSQLSD